MGDLSYRDLHSSRGGAGMSWDGATDYPTVYRGREVIRPLDIPNIHPLVEDSSPDDNDQLVKQYIGRGCGLASLITENLLIHPFIILRRQCQVNPTAERYHLVPITLLPIIFRLNQTQGLNSMWKGIGSVLLVRGMTLAVEDLVSKVTPWPKEITHNSLKSFGQHILLKCVSIGIITPFYSASLLEIVQSLRASENPGVLDVFRDGAFRLLDVGNAGRLIPIYSLLPPTIVYGVLKYLFTISTKTITSHIMRTKYKYTQELRGAYSRDFISESVAQDIEIKSILISMCAADVIFYPFETVIQRIHLQGTRTLIDNLDDGLSVQAVTTDYTGAINCYRTILAKEGPFGLYKGFGALILQFAAHVLVLKATKWILTEIGTMLKPKPKVVKVPPPSYYNEI